MDKGLIAKSDYIDVIYEGRNKAYGGYQLRRSYPDRMRKAGAITLLSITLFSSFSFIGREGNEKISGRNLGPVTITSIVPPPIANKVTPPAPATPPPLAGKQIKITPPVIVNDDHLEDVFPENGKIGTDNPGQGNHDGDSTAGPGSGSTGDKGVVTDAPKPAIPDQPKIFVDQMPVFAGNLNAYLAEHLQYPEEARNAGKEGRVAVKFVINEDGTISDISLVHGIGYGCDEAAIKVIATMPKWKPGKNNGIPVKVWFTQPITFKIDQ